MKGGATVTGTPEARAAARSAASRREARKKVLSPRLFVQLAILLLVVGGATLRNLNLDGAFLHFRLPELQGLCPFGAVRTLTNLLFNPGAVLRPDRSSLWVFAGVIGLAFFLGPAFCGWLCPLGTVQEWLGRLGRRLLGRKYNRLVPARLDRALGYLRYAVLAGAIAAGAAALVMDVVNPSAALVHMWTAAVPVSAVLLLAGVLAAALVVERPWCRWLCPLGALQGLVARLSPWTIRRNVRACTGCRRCDRACPMGIAVSRAEAIRNDRCNRCTRCVEACPEHGALAYAVPAAAGARLPLRRAAAAAAVLVTFSLPLAVASAVGWYGPAGQPAGLRAGPARPGVGTEGHAAAAASSARSGADHQPFEPAALSPRMTLGETAVSLGVEPGYLLELLGLEAQFELSTPLFDIEEHPDYEQVTFGYVRDVLEHRFGGQDS